MINQQETNGQSAFDLIMEGLEEARRINHHHYWVLGVYQTKSGKEYQKLLFSTDDKAEADAKADEFAHSTALTIKPSRVFISE